LSWISNVFYHKTQRAAQRRHIFFSSLVLNNLECFHNLVFRGDALLEQIKKKKVILTVDRMSRLSLMLGLILRRYTGCPY